MNFDTLFANPKGRTSRTHFVPALIVLAAVLAFYAFFVTGRTAHFCMLVLLYPAIVLHARRLHDMGQTAWLLAAPAVLAVGAFAIKLKYLSLGAQFDAGAPYGALAVWAVFSLWGCLGKGQAEANRFGAPLAA